MKRAVIAPAGRIELHGRTGGAGHDVAAVEGSVVHHDVMNGAIHVVPDHEAALRDGGWIGIEGLRAVLACDIDRSGAARRGAGRRGRRARGARTATASAAATPCREDKDRAREQSESHDGLVRGQDIP